MCVRSCRPRRRERAATEFELTDPDLSVRPPPVLREEIALPNCLAPLTARITTCAASTSPSPSSLYRGVLRPLGLRVNPRSWRTSCSARLPAGCLGRKPRIQAVTAPSRARTRWTRSWPSSAPHRPHASLHPCDFLGAFAAIRELFSLVPEARARGYKTGRFSFNVKGGPLRGVPGRRRGIAHALPARRRTCAARPAGAAATTARRSRCVTAGAPSPTSWTSPGRGGGRDLARTRGCNRLPLP